MNNKNRGLQGFLSIILSLSLLTVTVFFSGDLVNFITDFTLGAFTVMSGVNEFKRENSQNSSQAENEISGFGNSFVVDSDSADTKTPEDIEKLMNWDTKQVLTSGMMYDLFPTLSEEQQKVLDYLREKGKSQINIMTRELNFSYSTLSSLLFEMEMQDWVLSYPGGIYDLR